MYDRCCSPISISFAHPPLPHDDLIHHLILLLIFFQLTLFSLLLPKLLSVCSRHMSVAAGVVRSSLVAHALLSISLQLFLSILWNVHLRTFTTSDALGPSHRRSSNHRIVIMVANHPRVSIPRTSRVPPLIPLDLPLGSTATARLKISYPMLFQIRNPVTGAAVHVGILEFTAEEGRCYAPYWLMQMLRLENGQRILVSNVSLPKGSFVELRPHETAFTKLSNPRVVLERSLRSYSCLTKGQQIVIDYGSGALRQQFTLDVAELRPADAVSIIETDLSVGSVASRAGLCLLPPWMDCCSLVFM